MLYELFVYFSQIHYFKYIINVLGNMNNEITYYGVGDHCSTCTGFYNAGSPGYKLVKI